MPEFILESQLREAFSRMSVLLGREGTVGDIYIFGGAAMVLAYQAREATRDVVALFEPREKVHRAALEVADELGLPRWWLNDQATAHLPRVQDEQARLIFDHPNLRVTVVSAGHLLAMKALAARTYADLDDIAVLCDRLGVTEVRQVESLCARIYPDEPLTGRARLVVEDVLQRMQQQPTNTGRLPQRASARRTTIRPAITRSTMTIRRGSATFEYGDHTVTIKREFEAPMALVFDALTKPEHISVWFPADDVALHVCEIDLRVGGKYHYAWYAPGGMECSFRGQFLEIERPARIVSTWLFEGWPDDEAIESVILTEDDGITTMTDIMDFKTPDHLGDHFRENDGAQASWDKLDDLLADLQAGRPGTPG